MTSKNKRELLTIDTTHLTEAQIRQIKTLNTLLSQVLSTMNEGEFFDGSAEVMRLCAALIKQANFPTLCAEQVNIPYAQQAIEYSVDLLQEQLGASKLITYDN